MLDVVVGCITRIVICCVWTKP